MTTIPKTPSRSVGGSSTVWMLILGLISAFVLGCGSTTDLNQISGQQGGPIGGPQTGSLTFDFVQGQATEVPVGTTNIKFEFFSEDNAAGSKTVTPDVVRAFAAQIVIDNVPTTTRSVRVTAYNADGLPTRVFVVNVNVAAGTNTVVGDLGAGTAVTANGLTVTPTDASINVGNSQQFTAAIGFTNGEVISKTSATGLEWSTPPGSPATIAQTGIATGVSAGTAAITGSFAGQSDTVDLEVTAIDPGLTLVSVELEVDPEADIALGETVTFTVFGNFEDEEGEETRENITGSPDFTIALNVDDEDSDPSVLTADENNPFLFTGTAEGTATVQAVVSGGGLVEPLESNEVDVTVGALAFSVYGLDNGDLTLPNEGFAWQIVVLQTHPNGTVVEVDLSDVSFDSSDEDVAVVDEEGQIVTDDTGNGPTDITASRTDSENGPDFELEFGLIVLNGDPFLSFQLLIDGVVVTVDDIEEDAIALIVGQQVSFQVIAENGSNDNVDVTTSPQITFSGVVVGEEHVELSPSQRFLLALTATEDGPEAAAVTLSGNGVTGDPTLDFEIVVNPAP